jgi:hypothetical protein
MDKGKTEIICQLDVCDDIFVTAQHFKEQGTHNIFSCFIQSTKTVPSCWYYSASSVLRLHSTAMSGSHKQFWSHGIVL